ncbi:antitoxin [Caulobacter segnis]
MKLPTFQADDEAADAEGMADIAAGRLVPHEEVAAWLDTWGTSSERPAPTEWRRQG